jgi:hypothetical protein
VARPLVDFLWDSDPPSGLAQSPGGREVPFALSQALREREIDISEPFAHGDSAWDLVAQSPAGEIVLTIQRPLGGDGKEWIAEVRNVPSLWRRIRRSDDLERQADQIQEQLIRAVHSFLSASERVSQQRWFYPGFEGESDAP